eukprot:6481670-Amphidinium_carterae.1
MESMLSRDPSSRGVESMSACHSGVYGPERYVVQRGIDMNEQCYGFPLHSRNNAQATRYVSGPGLGPATPGFGVAPPGLCGDMSAGFAYAGEPVSFGPNAQHASEYPCQSSRVVSPMQTFPLAPNPYATRMGSQDSTMCDPHDAHASGVLTSDVRGTHDNESRCLGQNGSTNDRHGSSDPLFESDPWGQWARGRGMQTHGERQDAVNPTSMNVAHCAHGGDSHCEIPQTLPCHGHGCHVRGVDMRDDHPCNRNVNVNLDGFSMRNVPEVSAMFGGVPCVPSQRLRQDDGAGVNVAGARNAWQRSPDMYVDDLSHRAMSGAYVRNHIPSYTQRPLLDTMHTAYRHHVPLDSHAQHGGGCAYDRGVIDTHRSCCGANHADYGMAVGFAGVPGACSNLGHVGAHSFMPMHMSSHDYDSVKRREADHITVSDLPNPAKFRSWKLELKRNVAAASRSPNDAFMWVSETDQLAPFHSSLAHPEVRFQTLDAKLAVGLWKAIGHGELSRRVYVIAEKLASAGRMLAGRQILALVYEHYSTEAQSEQLYQLQDIMELRCTGDADLEHFWSTWGYVVGDVGGLLNDDMLRELLWTKIKHLTSLKEELSYYLRARDIPNHPDYSIGYLATVIESKLRRDRRERNREHVSQQLRSRGIALPAVDADMMENELPGDAVAMPAASDSKPKGICFNMVKHNKCSKGSACQYAHDPERVRKEQQRRKGKSPPPREPSPRNSPRNATSPRNSGGGRSPRDDRRPASPPRDSGGGSSPRANSPSAAMRSTSVCHEFKANGTCKYGDKCLFSHALYCFGFALELEKLGSCGMIHDNHGKDECKTSDHSISMPCHECDCGDMEQTNDSSDIVDIRHLNNFMSAMVCVEPHTRSWIIDSGSGEHLVGRQLLMESEVRSIQVMDHHVRLRTANGVITCSECVMIHVPPLGKSFRALVLEQAPFVLSMGRLATEEVFSGFENKNDFILRSDFDAIKCRVDHYVPFLDASMVSREKGHMNGDTGHTKSHNMDEQVETVVATKPQRRVTFESGPSPQHDSVMPKYNLVEFGCSEESVLSNIVVHGSHACSLRVMGKDDDSGQHVRKVVQGHMSNGLPTVLWSSITCDRDERFDLAGGLFTSWMELCDMVTGQGGIAVFEWPVTHKHWKSNFVCDFFDDPISKWRCTVVCGCAVGLRTASGRLSGERWLVYTNSAAMYDELNALSHCQCGGLHAEVEDAMRSGQYTVRFAIQVHKAIRRWIADKTWQAWGSLGGNVLSACVANDVMIDDASISMYMLSQRLQNQLKRLLPKSVSRTNVFTSDGGGVRGILLGANMSRGRGITRSTKYEVELLDTVLKIVRHAPVSVVFASVQINMYLKDVYMPWHTDLRNCSDSWVVSVGQYSGGLLEIEGCKPVDTHMKWTKIEQGHKHRVHSMTSGVRISLVFYTPKRFHLLPDLQLRFLRKCGFPVDAALQSSRNFEHSMKCSVSDASDAMLVLGECELSEHNGHDLIHEVLSVMYSSCSAKGSVLNESFAVSALAHVHQELSRAHTTKWCSTLEEAQSMCNVLFQQRGITTFPVLGLNRMYMLRRDDGEVVKTTGFDEHQIEYVLGDACNACCCACGQSNVCLSETEMHVAMHGDDLLTVETHAYMSCLADHGLDPFRLCCIEPSWYPSAEEVALPEGHRELHGAPPLWNALVTLNLSPKDPRFRNREAQAATAKELTGLVGRVWKWEEAVEMTDAKRIHPKGHFARVFLLIGIKHSEDVARQRYKARAVFGGHAIRDGVGQAATFHEVGHSPAHMEGARAAIAMHSVNRASQLVQSDAPQAYLQAAFKDDPP